MVVRTVQQRYIYGRHKSYGICASFSSNRSKNLPQDRPVSLWNGRGKKQNLAAMDRTHFSKQNSFKSIQYLEQYLKKAAHCYVHG